MAPCPAPRRISTLLQTSGSNASHLSSRRNDAQSIPQLILTHRARRIDLVAEEHEGDFRELLDGEERVEFGFGFVESFRVLRVDEEDDSVNFGEVVLP